MKLSSTVIFLFAQIAVFAQSKEINLDNKDPNPTANVALFTAGALPATSVKYVTLTGGSPYFNDSWMRGKVVLSGGGTCDSLRARFDLLSNALLFKAKDGSEMTASTPLRSIMLTDTISKKEYFFVHSDYMMPTPSEAGWYQLLTAGNATLYKRTTKKIIENRPYGSSITEQSINTSDHYYILTNGYYTKLRRIKDLPDILANKSNDLSKYISSRKLSGKSEQDFIDVVAEYNYLLQ